MISSVFTAFPYTAAAASKPVKLSKKSATLTVSKKTKITFKKKKGVKLSSVSFKSSNKKVASVTKKGKVTAKKAGKATIKIKLRYTYKGKKFKLNLKFKVKVKKKTFYPKLSDFSNKLYSMSAKDEKGNYTMSPISVYMALAMLYSIGDKGVKNDVKSLTKMNDADFQKTKSLYNKLNRNQTFNGETISRLSLTNTLWLDSNNTFNSDAVSRLNKETACNAHNVPFAADNKTANNKIREFIKENTNGLIDKDFNLSSETLLALINTLYFKDAWDNESRNLQTEKRSFTTPQGKSNHEFLIGKYIQGRAAENKLCSYYYAQTASGYKIKFILPKSGHTLPEVMKASNLSKINSKKDYKGTDKDGTEHFTRCIFPSFKLESDTPLMTIFIKNKVLKNAFSVFNSDLTPTPMCVSDMKHNVVLDINKEGVEGAAVTIFAAKATAVLPTVPRKYHDFILNKSFGFIVTDPSDIILFEGQVTNP
jgi:serpin B